MTCDLNVVKSVICDGQHSLHVDDAVMLVKFLTSLTSMTQVAIRSTMLVDPSVALETLVR
jgi:hypothetical protein